MRLLDRYILRHVSLAFLLYLTILTLLIWLVASLRQFNLITTQGQSLLIFLSISTLALPSLIVIIAPVALFIAIVWSLNRLNSDSELVVMSSAGLAPRRLLVPYGILTALVAASIALMTLYVQPLSQRQLRVWIVQVGADVISRMVRPGQFTQVRQGITVHVREKTNSGTLLGVLVQDESQADQTLTYIAERGQVIETRDRPDKRSGLYLFLEKGSVQRQTKEANNDSAIVVFETYAFDLSQLIEPPDITYSKPRERFTSELISMVSSADNIADQGRKELGRIRSELADRLTAPLYPIAFMFVALAALAWPRTTRQGRAGAIAGAIAAIMAVRILGFVLTETLSVRSMFGLYLAIGLPIAVSVFACLFITGVLRPELPGWLAAPLSRITARLRRVFQPTRAGA